MFKLEDGEYLESLQFELTYSNWKLNNDILCQTNTNSNSINDPGCWISIVPFDKLKNNRNEEITLSNYVKSNLDLLIKENTEDLLLEADSNGEVVFWQGIGLQSPITKDFNGDGINDVFSAIYRAGAGDVTQTLTDDEKSKLITRWGVFLGTNSESDSLVFTMGFRYDEKSEGTNFNSVDLNNDGFIDILSVPGAYHGTEENTPDYYRDGKTPPSKIFWNDGNGNFSVDSTSNQVRINKFIQLDNDPNYEFIGTGQEGSKSSIITWGFSEGEITATGEYSTEYDYIFDYENYDLNKDGFQDVILLSSDLIEPIRTYTYSVFYGSDEGVRLDKEFNHILYQFDTPSHIQVEGNPFTIIKFNDDTDLIVMWLLNQWFNNEGMEDDGEAKTRLRAFKISNSTLEEVTTQIFPDGLNLNYINLGSPPIFNDLNGDGLLDLYFVNNSWFNGNNPIEIPCLINNGTFFDPKHFSTFHLFDGYSVPVEFHDIDSDGVFEMIMFTNSPLYNQYPNVDQNLNFYPFDILYENEINESPTDLTLSNFTIEGNQEIGSEIGTFNSTDINTNETYIYSLISGGGGADNGSFTISGDILKSGIIFDYDTKSNYSIRVQTFDSYGNVFSKSITISITETQLSVDDEILDNSLKLYPNPVTNILTIESKNVAISKVEIYSILGEKIKEITSNFGSIATDNLPNGIYIIKIYSEKGMVMKKTIKM